MFTTIVGAHGRTIRGIKPWLLMLFFLSFWTLSLQQLPSDRPIPLLLPSRRTPSVMFLNANQFPPVPPQLNVKVELVVVDDHLVEEFLLTWDEEYNLARYDYSLGRIMPPYKTLQPMRTIHDYGNGISFNMWEKNCSMLPLGYMLLESNATGPFRRPQKLVRNITIDQLLRTLHPKQLFFMGNNSLIHNLSSTERSIRGIPCEVWTVFDDNYYIPGYGVARTRQELYFMTKEFTHQLLGQVPHMIPVQRQIFLAGLGYGPPTPKLVFNFFDFTVPPVPTAFDFNISGCTSKWATEKQFLDTSQSVQFRFAGNFSSLPSDLLVQPFRRGVLNRIIELGDISPVRVAGLYPSKDSNNMYMTATILPRVRSDLFFTLVDKAVKKDLLKSPPASTAGGLVLISRLFELHSVEFCASFCLLSLMNCSQFAYCEAEGKMGRPDQRCLIAYDKERSAAGAQEGPTRTYSCDVYQTTVNRTTFGTGVSEALMHILLQLREFDVTVEGNGQNITLQANQMRDDVALYGDATGPTSSRASSSNIAVGPAKGRSSFDFYRAEANIVNDAVKARLSQLSSSDCRVRCLDEKRFVCHSVASCSFGDCVLSNLHGDELLNSSSIDGTPHLISHTACTIWARTWESVFSWNTWIAPSALPDEVHRVSNRDTCAKKCLFGNSSCESFSVCARPEIMPSTSEDVSILTSDCLLFKTHGLKLMASTNQTDVKFYDHASGCMHLNRDFTRDFEQLTDFELVAVTGTELIERETESLLEEMHCAKQCLDQLGDNCLSFDVCENNRTGGEENWFMDKLIIRCRISSLYIGPPVGSSKNIQPNSNCTLFTRTTYMDGSKVNPKTASGAKQLLTFRTDNKPVISSADEKQVKFYSPGEMTAVGVGMVVAGAVLTVVLFVLVARQSPLSAVVFTKQFPFVHFP